MIEKDLAVAKRRKSLINVYQKTSEVFYTGYVYVLGNDGVVIRTFNEYGMADGMVFLNFGDIYHVEFYSNDLTAMGVRIRVAQLNGLLEYTRQTPMKLLENQDLTKQILGRSFVEVQEVMLELTDRAHYIEGFVEKIGKNQISFMAINKFHFERREKMTISYDKIEVIEFQGKELTLLSKSKSLLMGKSIPTVSQSAPEAIMKGLKKSYQDHQLIEVESVQDQNYFYVGWVVAINSKDVMMKVIDMSGQFGGYVLMRLDSPCYLAQQSDYLRIINHFVEVNRKAKNLVQPVLNDDRVFDPTEDMAPALLRQALVMHRLVRIRTKGEAHSEMGYPSQLRQGVLLFRPVNESQTGLSVAHEISLNDLQEIAFDYLGTYLVKKQLDVQSWKK
ncbi:hypothetical protein [Acetilactobacillus jinshanensis]|uniref:Uncharacterized protein n=1 Tax=Acetilactobacillus jinshanensis TaxID=1720083 RepID=A0A4P6ZK34_9LACO|nr:hypothetical protein [Acetilactobacillus jinshanensis]QBP17772.1 hypothetical protein ELX58_00975 [Acetilactobacillus jinshanensis]URL60634.1 hypothetical protein HGK75_01000 [uncultured bacterium]